MALLVKRIPNFANSVSLKYLFFFGFDLIISIALAGKEVLSHISIKSPKYSPAPFAFLHFRTIGILPNFVDLAKFVLMPSLVRTKPFHMG